MKLAKDCIANNRSVLLNLSFSPGIFPDKLKIAKILSVFLKRIKTRMLKLKTNFDAFKS